MATLIATDTAPKFQPCDDIERKRIEAVRFMQEQGIKRIFDMTRDEFLSRAGERHD